MSPVLSDTTTAAAAAATPEVQLVNIGTIGWSSRRLDALVRMVTLQSWCCGLGDGLEKS